MNPSPRRLPVHQSRVSSESYTHVTMFKSLIPPTNVLGRQQGRKIPDICESNVSKEFPAQGFWGHKIRRIISSVFSLLLLAGLMACGGAESVPTPQVQPAIAVEMSPTIPQPTFTAKAEPAKPSLAPIVAEALVSVGGVSFQVEAVLTEEKRAQGLSNRIPLAPRAGMLFIYSEERKRSFWMKDMLFPLDIIWIAMNCTVADITENAPVPEPGQAERDLPRFSPKVPVVHVLEINAGTSGREGITIGDPVVFSGSLEGRYVC